MQPIWIAFLTGLTTGGLSCLAVQGGLLASVVSQRRLEGIEPTTGGSGRWSAIALFIIAKVIAYTILGFVLGFVGSSMVLAPKLMGLLQIFVGLYLVATAARIADIHPIFRYTVIQPPTWVYRFLKRQSKESSWFAPGIMGFFTILMPCGVTQAMMVTALATGNAWISAGIMAAFVIGTSPVFLLLGLAVLEFLKRKFFSYAAASLVAAFGVLSINGGIALQGSFYTLQNFYRAATMDVSSLQPSQGQIAGISTDGKQEVTIYVRNNGYSIPTKTLKAGVPVRLSLVTDNTGGCSRAFTIPDYNISKVLPATGTEIIEFTPTKAGALAYTCAMGMYTGQFTII